MVRNCVQLILIACMTILLPSLLGMYQTVTSRLDLSTQFGRNGRRFLLDVGLQSHASRTLPSQSAQVQSLLLTVSWHCAPSPHAVPRAGEGTCTLSAVAKAAEAQ